MALRWPYSDHKSWQPAGNTHCEPCREEELGYTQPAKEMLLSSEMQVTRIFGVYTEEYQRSRKERDSSENLHTGV